MKDGWYVEPQVELNWLNNGKSSFTTSQGNQVTNDGSQTLNSRLGLAGGRLIKRVGRKTQVYGRLDWSDDLSSNGRGVHQRHQF